MASVIVLDSLLGFFVMVIHVIDAADQMMSKLEMQKMTSKFL